MSGPSGHDVVGILTDDDVFQTKAEEDLKQAHKDGYTLQFYGINKWLPTVASLAAQLTQEAVSRPG